MNRYLLMKLLWLPFTVAAAIAGAQGYDALDVETYIETYHRTAIDEMERTGIPASITLAQGIVESGAGKSLLATEANNHFGIKCHNDWTGPGYYYDDDRKNECFRQYPSADASFRDHSEFLTTRQRYAVLFTYDAQDYKAWARGLKSCGYATNPQYANILIRCIEEYDLHQWDLPEKDRASWFAALNKSSGSDERAADASIRSSASEAPVAEANPGSRIFIFNDIKCVTLRKGESLNDLATAYEIGIGRLMRYNDITEATQLGEGDRVYLQPKRHNGDEKYHTVQEGETMFDISKQHGIQLGKLCEKNRVSSRSLPMAGEVIYLQEHRDTPPRLIQNPNGATSAGSSSVAAVPAYHTVVKGDTLFGISKKYDLTIEELKAINGKSSDNLYVGERLKVNKQ